MSGITLPPSEVNVFRIVAAIRQLAGNVRSQREVLSADRIYYVRADGNDSNTGFSNTAGAAWLTKQKAMDVIAGSLDVGNQDVQVSVADGTYTAGVQIKPWTGGGTVSFVGNETTPANCLLNLTGTNGFDASFGPIPGQFFIKGFKIATTGSFGIVARSPGRLIYTNMNFGAAGGVHVAGIFSGQIEFYGNNTISAGSNFHFYAEGIGQIRADALDLPAVGTYTLSGTPAFQYFAAASGGYISILPSLAFSGAATTSANRALVQALGRINVYGGGDSFFPGTAGQGVTRLSGDYA